MMRVPLVHCHGSGNDFPLIDARALAVSHAAWSRLAVALANRDGPVGGDGLLLLTDGDAGHAFGMTMFNPDGSEAETCLNGVRCVARAGFAALGIAAATMRLVSSSVQVRPGAPLAPGVATIVEVADPARFALGDFPIGEETGEAIERHIAVLPTPRAVTAVLMPNPHLVAFVERIDEDELVALGVACEAAPAWLPRRANVSFVERRAAATLFVRTFERGVGLTDSCGSAMAAATVAAWRTGRIAAGQDVVVLNRGGMVRASVDADARVTIAGNATWEWSGSIAIDPDAGSIGDLVVEQRHDDEAAAWAALRRSLA